MFEVKQTLFSYITGLRGYQQNPMSMILNRTIEADHAVHYNRNTSSFSEAMQSTNYDFLKTISEPHSDQINKTFYILSNLQEEHVLGEKRGNSTFNMFVQPKRENTTYMTNNVQNFIKPMTLVSVAWVGTFSVAKPCKLF